jgi:leucyl aminopeptidase
MFNLILKTGNKKISYKDLSVSLRYLIDEKKLDESLANIERVSNLHLSELQKKSFLSKNGSEVRISKKNGKPDEVFIFKVKLDNKFSNDFFRNHLAGFLPQLEKEEIKSLHIFIPNYTVFQKFFEKEEYFYQSFIEGIFLGNYSFNYYKSEKEGSRELSIHFYADDEKKLKAALASAQNLMEGVNFTKDLENEPAIALNPDALAKRVVSVLSPAGVKVTVFDEKEIKKRKMGGLTAVGMGSKNSPRFIVMEYNLSAKNKSKKRSKKIALVGKGVTFDSGGISIKPSNDMWEMKADMSGAAVVAGTILAAARAKLPVNLIGIIPAAENMPSGNSVKPGDIIFTGSGKTVEIIDTDAEGRVILADALDFASKEKPDAIIDLATLTGACVVALGEFVAGLFTKDESLSKKLFNSGLTTHDLIWPLPMWDDYHELNKSELADVKNLGGRWGGAISAAKFLENFVDKKIPWAHLDIAGPSIANSYNNYSKKYMTGFGVRLLFEFLKKEMDSK